MRPQSHLALEHSVTERAGSDGASIVDLAISRSKQRLATIVIIRFLNLFSFQTRLPRASFPLPGTSFLCVAGESAAGACSSATRPPFLHKINACSCTHFPLPSNVGKQKPRVQGKAERIGVWLHRAHSGQTLLENGSQATSKH